MGKKVEIANAQTVKSLLYLGHSYHNKTKSSLFLKDLFRSSYEVETVDIDPYTDSTGINLEHLKRREYDVLVLFQVTPNIDQLKDFIRFKHAVFFPMLDGLVGVPDSFWETYWGFNIISFSRTLHKHLIHLGLSSHYIQYFPRPFDTFAYGNPKHVFFWQRISELSINVVEKLLKKSSIDKIHIHKALDPFQKFIEPSEKMATKIEYSNWYETRKDMLKEVESCAIYIAPRPYEGIGMSFLEAMAMGRCIIAPNHPTMNEYIIHGVTGFLYNYNHPKAIKIDDVTRIQKNTIEYIREGYVKWEKEKYNILEWLEAPILNNRKLKPSNQHKCNKIYFLFASVPLLVEKKKANKKYYDLFGHIRLMKSKEKENRIIFYLFGLIPILKIKRL